MAKTVKKTKSKAKRHKKPDRIADLADELLDPSTAKIPKVYSNKTLSNQTIVKLIPYQVPHVVKMIEIINQKGIALDCSDAGIGKTFMSLAIAKELGKRPFIICPSSVLSYWASVTETMGVVPYEIVNLETFKMGNVYRDFEFKKRRKSRHIDLGARGANAGDADYYVWHLPVDAVIILDEGHRCKEPGTENGKLLMSMKQLMIQRIPVMVLSATICEKFTDMKILFYLFGAIPAVRQFNEFVRSLEEKYDARDLNKKRRGESREEYITRRDNAYSMMIHSEIREYVSRIKIRDLGDKFPSNQWCAQLFNAPATEEIAQRYAALAEHLRALRGAEDNGHHLGEIVKLKQEIESRKVPIFIEQAKLHLEDGKSVIIFVNYTETLKKLCEILEIKCKVYGDQTKDERNEAIALFQSNKERIIICNIKAGGVGISLHDLDGNFPRVTLLNFCARAGDLLQALGRAPRSGAKSPVIQRIICVANVEYEKTVMKCINRKLMNISAINDGDLFGYRYKIRKIRRV